MKFDAENMLAAGLGGSCDKERSDAPDHPFRDQRRVDLGAVAHKKPTEVGGLSDFWSVICAKLEHAPERRKSVFGVEKRSSLI